MRFIGQWLLGLTSARAAVLEEANLDRFRRPMDRKLRVGLVLLVLGLLTGWPLVALLGAMALWLGKPWLLALGGPAAYAISWVIYGAGLLVAGVGSVVYLREVNRWIIRRLVELLFRGREAARKAAEAAARKAEKRAAKKAEKRAARKVEKGAGGKAEKGVNGKVEERTEEGTASRRPFP